MMEKIYDSVIIGGGIAGYTAALALNRFRREYLWIGLEPFGGKLLLAEHVQNFPSFSGSGKELSELLFKQMKEEGVLFTKGKIDGVYAAGNYFYITQGQSSYTAKTVILATGVETSGALKGEEEFLGRGVSYCAVCDGSLYRGKTIAAVISSKEYEKEAEYLAGFAKEVYCFCSYPKPEIEGKNLSISSVRPQGIEGKERVEYLLLQDGSKLCVDGIFLLKNSQPPSSLVGGLETQNGHVKTNADQSTNLKGLYAAGDVTGRPYQYVKAAGEGLVAAYSVNEFLSKA